MPKALKIDAVLPIVSSYEYKGLIEQQRDYLLAVT